MIDSEPGVRTKVAALAEVTKVGPGVEDDVFPDDPIDEPESGVVDGAVDGVVDGVVEGVVDEDDGTEVLVVLEPPPEPESLPAAIPAIKILKT